MKNTKIITHVVTIVLTLLSILLGFLIVNIVHPPKFELFTSNYTEEAIKEYFNAIEISNFYNVSWIIIIDILPILLLIVLIKSIKTVYKSYDINGKIIFIDALVGAILMFIFSNVLNYGILAEIEYFINTYFWLN